jgi:hypothetical protein
MQAARQVVAQATTSLTLEDVPTVLATDAMILPGLSDNQSQVVVVRAPLPALTRPSLFRRTLAAR